MKRYKKNSTGSYF